ncbi:hypothetical protein FCULG_00005627 [Fusarium culmorum]|uniref:Uncharacterized protein n=1 Tax=Fusarium culmorum TaxID=5516 RepID=A0A2T4GUI1_FUSCU|nr:hypothetical protein FCULG_00005627 [Fusarium culmorum]
MKATLILALPAIAMAAATPPTVEPRQLPFLWTPNAFAGLLASPTVLPTLEHATSLPINVVNALVAAATQCVRLPLPVKE